MRRIVASLIVILTILYQPQVTDAERITFDESGPASILFSQVLPLRDEYSATRGVHFRGPGENDGGAVLNIRSSFPPPSGFNALTFNADADLKGQKGKAKGPETIIFDYLWADISISVSSLGRDMDHFKLTAFDEKDQPVAWSELKTKEWDTLKIHWAEGIKSVVLEKKSNDSFAADDLVFVNRVPEPGTVILLGLGLLGIGISARKKR